MEHLVSVCIPAYNNEKYIKDTIESILNQTYQNIELVVVDDCSTDSTWDIISSIEDPRMKAYKNEQNLGMSGNWNKCLSLTTGEFVKLICADDVMDNNAIEIEAKAMAQNPTAVLVESDTRLVDVEGKVNGVFQRYKKSGLVDGKEIVKKSLIWNNFFGAPVNNLIRKSALEQVGGFDESFTYILDFDLWVSLACIGDVYIIHDELNSFCVRSDSNTGVLIGRKRNVYVEEHRRLVEKHVQNGNIELTKRQINFSVWFRKFRNVVIGIYLRMFAKERI
jgi:glycosyltransferase involved in cell wall biosynthesis